MCAFFQAAKKALGVGRILESDTFSSSLKQCRI